jgi:AI-2 transport protein TqsA
MLADHDDDQNEASPNSMQGGKALIMLACLCVFITGLKLGASFLMPIAVAFFLSILSYPIMNWLMRKRVPHVIALILTMGIIVLSVGLIIYAGTDLLRSFLAEFPSYLTKLKGLVEESAVWLEKTGGVEGAIRAVEQFNLQSLIDLVNQQVGVKNLASFAGSTFGTVATFLTSFVIVMVLMMFTLMEAPGTNSRAQVVRQAGGPDLSILVQSATDIQKYLGVKTLISLVTGILACFWCYMFDLKYPVLWGILAFVFNYIPAVGSTVAGLPAVLEALVQHGVGSAVGVMIGYAVINFCLDNLIQPMLIGRRFGISGLVIVLSVIFWGWLWGPVGMFLAVPLTMMMKVILENTQEFRWVSVAMAKKKVKHGEVVLDMPPMDDEDLLGSGAATEPPR